MADVSYGGFAPRRNQGIIGRSLSFCTGRNMTWRSTASPVDIPGASPPKPSTRRCLLSASVPESTDAVLSRSILEQCRIADRTCDTSPRASLKECGSWASRTCSEAAGSSSITPWSTWKASSSSSKEGGGGVAAQSLGKSSCNHQMTSASVKTEFAKRREPQKQARDQVSALSVALRGLSRSALNVAEGQRDQIGAAQREHRRLCQADRLSTLEEEQQPEEEGSEPVPTAVENAVRAGVMMVVRAVTRTLTRTTSGRG
ncbi:hypothetical protein M406DRAFT_331340 [Cryphonectria parasitica EP155]|uniref:Uncharacterized protein n=1 Tax=Cryphonectria parasitica (strain ATCC 38755 / EP155) TaxID=660469 RepID=A0A9P4Y1X1_CRYP1|nr:uncharacterized protein M406DRAFT_331340 [Cryphonectria parasitica EP155]KAF3765026.1 hypothetical protein M406DRAFT_331340 [Cryphonectria parasitica EP155]